MIGATSLVAALLHQDWGRGAKAVARGKVRCSCHRGNVSGGSPAASRLGQAVKAAERGRAERWACNTQCHMLCRVLLAAPGRAV